MYYPIQLDLRGRQCLVVGAGKVAERRILGLQGTGAHIVVVAPEATPAIIDMTARGEIEWIGEQYSADHLEGAFLVIAASDRREVNEAAADDANERGLLVNVVDAPDDGNFIVPASVRQGDFLVTVSTSGRSPTLASVVQEDLEWEYGPHWAGYTELFAKLRADLKSTHGTEDARKAAVRRVIDDGGVRDSLLRGDMAEAEALARLCL